MSYDVQQGDISILGQKIKQLDIKLILLNDNFQPIDELSGEIFNGTITVDSQSDIRRNVSVSFFVRNKKYITNDQSRIWFNKLIQIKIGIKTIRTQTYQYYPMGTFLFTENSYTYNSTSNLLTVKCVDIMHVLLMINLYGTQNYTIPAGNVIRDAMISAVTQLGGLKKYLIGDVGNEYGSKINAVTEAAYNLVPYDLKFTSDDTVYSVVTKLRDLYAGWETFCDNDTFVCQMIPTGSNESVILDYQTIENKHLVISEQLSNNFDKVKNITQVFGNQIDVDRYTENCTNTGAQYNATFEDLSGLESGYTYAVKLNVPNLANPTLKVNDFTVYPITNSDGETISAGTINGYSAFKFYDNKFMYLGQYQVEALAVHVSVMPDNIKQKYYQAKFNTKNIRYAVNPDSPFTVEKIGERIDVKSGETYSKIYSQDLALQRAVYENWLTTRLQDTMTLEMQLIPWLDVNKLITYKSFITGNVDYYMIKSINIELLNGTMTVTAMKYYPLYPDL